MHIENNTLIMSDGQVIMLPTHAVASHVKIWRVPTEYRADGLFVAVTIPGAPEKVPACNLADCTLLGELDYPADAGAVLDLARAQRLAQARAAVDAAAQAMLADVPDFEQHTWPIQLAEAQALQAAQALAGEPLVDEATLAPLLSGLATARGLGESVSVLADKVLAAAARHQAAIGPLLGRWQGIERALLAAPSLDALYAVEISLTPA